METTFRDRIREVMKLKGIRQIDLARALDKEQSWVSARLTGTRQTTIDDLNEICEAIREPNTYILSGQVQTNTETGSDSSKIPVIELSKVDHWPALSQEIEIKQWVQPFSTNHLSATAVASEMPDDTMSPKIFPKSLLVIEKQDTAQIGDIAVATVSGRPIVREMATDGLKRFLKPENPIYEMIKIDSKVSIIGVVREAITLF